MKAFLKNNRQAPRKVRLIANNVRGANVKTALADLSVMPHKAAQALSKLIGSALANALQVHPGRDAGDFVVRSITVDKGMTFVRFMPRAFGRATPINRECSHIRVELAFAEGVAAAAKAPAAKKSEKAKKETANA